MYGIIFASIATLIGEVGKTIGKNEVAKRLESILDMGFLNSLWGTLIFCGIVIFVPADTSLGEHFGKFHFTLERVPLILFSVRALLTIVLINLVLRVATIATRSTFAFLRMLTIPFLLLVDIYQSYNISQWRLQA